MSDTTFVYAIDNETGRVDPIPRVTLTLDADEVMAIGMVASAAIDAAVLASREVSELTASNAQIIYNWAQRAFATLELAAQGAEAGRAEE